VPLVEYMRFIVRAFERQPGKWRANIRRADGKPVKIIGRKKFEQSATCFDAPTAIAAIFMAMAAIPLERSYVTEWPRRNSGVFGDGRQPGTALPRPYGVFLKITMGVQVGSGVRL